MWLSKIISLCVCLTSLLFCSQSWINQVKLQACRRNFQINYYWMIRVGVLVFFFSTFGSYYFFSLACWLCLLFRTPPPCLLNDYSELQKWVVNRGIALHWCDYSAPSSAGSMPSPGSRIFAFCATQYSINAFSLPKLLKLFNPQRLITLPSSYNLLITVSLTQVTPWLILMLSWPILMYAFQIKQLLIA